MFFKFFVVYAKKFFCNNLEGTIEASGMTAQVRTSYLPGEILWGHKLKPLITYQKFNRRYRIDYSDFHTTIPIQDMPECSASDYANKTVVPNFHAEDNLATLSLKGKSAEKRRFSKRRSTDIRGAFKKFKRSSVGGRHHESLDK